jgi:hypothetical protein
MHAGVRQPGQGFSNFAEMFYSAIDRLDLVLHESSNIRAIAPGLPIEREKRLDFSQGESQRLRSFDESNPAHIICRKHPVSGGEAARARQQAHALVVPDRLRIDPGLSSELAALQLSGFAHRRHETA